MMTDPKCQWGDCQNATVTRMVWMIDGKHLGYYCRWHWPSFSVPADES